LSTAHCPLDSSSLLGGQLQPPPTSPSARLKKGPQRGSAVCAMCRLPNPGIGGHKLVFKPLGTRQRRPHGVPLGCLSSAPHVYGDAYLHLPHLFLREADQGRRPSPKSSEKQETVTRERKKQKSNKAAKNTTLPCGSSARSPIGSDTTLDGHRDLRLAPPSLSESSNHGPVLER
jgi:hypothetical protein